MKKIIILLFIFTFTSVFAKLFYTPSEYNATYNQKVALELEVKSLKKQ